MKNLPQKRNLFLTFTLIFFVAYLLLISFIASADFLIFSLFFAAFYAATLLVVYLVFVRFSQYLQSIRKITDEVIAPAEQVKNLDETARQVSTIADKLSYYDQKLSKRQQGFDTIIESIGEVIWIQKTNGLIKVFNQAFCDLVADDNPKNKYFWNVIRQRELYEFVDNIQQNPTNKLQKISAEKRTLLCSSSYLEDSGEIVFILHDTTELQQLELIKKDLILNVSHELRTPLTSIKGFLETLEDELDSEHAYYIEVIKRNTDRLIHIVNDLLILTKLEHVQKLELEQIDLPQMIQNTLLLFEENLKAKNLQLQTDIPADLPLLQADYFKLEQVLINLIDNAIKYTDFGEIQISISAQESLLIKISDSGRGIPAQHLQRLFERFYVVDKSRSRKLGGTGLGLSIVKHIVQLHQGQIEVESQIGSGTTFTVTLPWEQNEPA
ncbi:MAG: ATP-binding protein [Candidatus Cloacimonadales bacterium]